MAVPIEVEGYGVRLADLYERPFEFKYSDGRHNPELEDRIVNDLIAPAKDVAANLGRFSVALS